MNQKLQEKLEEIEKLREKIDLYKTVSEKITELEGTQEIVEEVQNEINEFIVEQFNHLSSGSRKPPKKAAPQQQQEAAPQQRPIAKNTTSLTPQEFIQISEKFMHKTVTGKTEAGDEVTGEAVHNEYPNVLVKTPDGNLHYVNPKTVELQGGPSEQQEPEQNT